MIKPQKNINISIKEIILKLHNAYDCPCDKKYYGSFYKNYTVLLKVIR